MSKICLCLTSHGMEQNRAALQEYLGYYDLAELRVDCLKEKNTSDVKAFLEDCQTPVILTCRRVNDGGFFKEYQEQERLELLRQWMKLPFAYVDLEWDLGFSWEEEARINGLKPIRSFHDFHGCPSDLREKLHQDDREDLWVKAAVSLNRKEDYEAFFHALQGGLPKNRILLAMGAPGIFSRVLANPLGSYLTFTSPSNGQQAAPGHLDPKELVDLYRFREIDSHTPVYGILGNPLGHSKSPQIHNGWLKEDHKAGVYLSFTLPHIDCWEPLEKNLDLKGLSVTIPYKISIMDYVHPSERALKIGACNTLIKEKDLWLGENTDSPGFLAPLLDAMNCSDLHGKKALVIGAGGAARAVVYALTEAGARVLVLNRTVEKAQALADEFKQEWATLSKDSLDRLSSFREIIVQTTGIGMAPHEEGDPLAFYDFKGDELLYDIIYNPRITTIMERAEKAGAKILGGLAMLEGQAKLQYKLFTSG